MGIPLNIDWQQILLHLFNFAILVGGLYFLLYSPIKRFIAKREEHYRSMDDEANAKLASASALEEEMKVRLDNANNEIKEHRVKAETEIEEYLTLKTGEANKKADKIIADAQKTAYDERKRILDSADKDILEMTRQATAKMVHSGTDDAYKQFLDIAERDIQNDE